MRRNKTTLNYLAAKVNDFIQFAIDAAAKFYFMLQAFIKYISNRKKNDKYSLGYFIGMVDAHSCCSLWPENFKRQELLDRLIELAGIGDNIHRLVCSDYTRKQVAKYMN